MARGSLIPANEVVQPETAAQPVPEAPRDLYPIGYAAHELGHASNQELAKHPALKKMLERGVRWGGALGSGIAMGSRRPGMAALMSGLSSAPTLVEEGRASLKGYKALKEHGDLTPEELGKVRKQLMLAGGTYLGGALGSAGASALFSNPGMQEMPTMSRVLISRGMGVLPSAILSKKLKGMRGASRELGDVEKLRSDMGLETPIYRGSELLREGGGAVYVQPGNETKIPILKQLRENAVKGLVHKGTPAQARALLQRGGIVVPTEKTGAAEEQPRKSRLGQIAKGVGTGLGSLAIAGGITYGALRPGQRQIVRRLVRRPHLWKDEVVRHKIKQVAKHPNLQKAGLDAEKEFKRWRDTHGRSDSAWLEDVERRVSEALSSPRVKTGSASWATIAQALVR